MSREPILYGLDGFRGGWIAACKAPGVSAIRWKRLDYPEGLAGILADIESIPVLAIDIPIGLRASGRRECDTAARLILGARAGSVFSAPILEVLAATGYAEACAIRERIEGKRMSRQAWGIVRKVREVELLRGDHPGLRQRLREVHPEVSFLLMNGRRPLEHSKKSAEGFRERVRLLERHLGIGEAFILEARRSVKVPRDDLVDALAALWTAERIHLGLAERLPADGGILEGVIHA